MPLDVVAVLAAAGGRSTYRRLVAVTSRRDLRAAVRHGEVVALGRGRYGLPGGPAVVHLALGQGGAASYLTAAEVHGWGVVRTSQRCHAPGGSAPGRTTARPTPVSLRCAATTWRQVSRGSCRSRRSPHQGSSSWS